MNFLLLTSHHDKKCLSSHCLPLYVGVGNNHERLELFGDAAVRSISVVVSRNSLSLFIHDDATTGIHLANVQ